MTAQPAFPVERTLNHPASSSLFIRIISLKSALPIPSPYLEPFRVSTNSRPSFMSLHRCAYSLITECRTSTLLTWTNVTGYFVNMYEHLHWETSLPLHAEPPLIKQRYFCFQVKHASKVICIFQAFLI